MSTTTLITAEELPGEEGLAPGWLRISEGVVVGRGAGRSAETPQTRCQTVLPGFTDTHCHGAVGLDFGQLGTDPTPAVEHHHQTGSTTVVASLATNTHEHTVLRLRELAPLVRQGLFAGIHLEGPFLSHEHRGAHNPELLTVPTPQLVEELLEASEGTLTTVTLAPELTGSLAAIRQLSDAGVAVALGHTAATAAEFRDAIDAGASVVTHLFNGMPSLHHRAPGPVGVALSDQRVTMEIIADGHHVHAEAIDVARQAAADRLLLISDAMAATGLGDGDYELATAQVRVTDGVAMLADGSSLAGSASTLADAVPELVDRGADTAEVLSLTSTVPRRAAGLAPHTLALGERADLVALRGGALEAVMKEGRWLS